MEHKDLDAIISEADSLYSHGRLNEALDAYHDALDRDSNSAWAHSRVGAILAQKGDLAGAEQALRKSIELDPSLPQAHSNLGNVHYARGEYDAALDKYQEAISLSPTTAVYHENLHAAYKKLGKLGDAVIALKQAHRLEREGSKAEAKNRIETVKQRVKGRVGCLPVLITLVAIPLIIVHA